MLNEIFHNVSGPFTIIEIANFINAKVYNLKDKKLSIYGAADVDNAVKGEITFININSTMKKLKNSSASACIVNKYDKINIPKEMVCLEVDNAHVSFAIIAQKFYPQAKFETKVSNYSNIPKKYMNSFPIRVDPFVHIEEGAIIEKNVWIGSNSFIGKGVRIGENTRISSNVSIECAEIGKNVLIYSGVKIGQSGFGFAPSQNGHIKIPQVGIVKIGDNVEIGSNTCIDRGSHGPTSIGDGTFIDNLVHIAHNVSIGKHCAIAGQVGIAGSAVIEDYCMFGGQVGIGGHITIGRGSQAGGQSGITRSILAGSKVSGTPAIPLSQYHRQALKLQQLIRAKGK
ncbi:MAG: UDP-3-O-acylglucosamine N-acyltransferase [Alphaproteobacteria bacterium MarineAlpha9_Bin3]|nr:MAG: UDP-3-O-acylglucosamine N-acyltransferase [Alphaproteobacteria bacterium MarineAlpha9_Bin3]|tara:strand:+ start:17584 stop:18606 length:1023 start_codon:yes stop_codon:yes gene_type:complete